MLISVDWEIRIAFLENGKLIDFYIEPQGIEETKGNIYKGIVEQVNSSINAAFVNIGLDKNAFLALDAVDYDIYHPDKGAGEKYNINSVLKEKDEVLVQVTKDATQTKGACISTFTSIPGRYLVLFSTLNSSGVSKKIISQKERMRIQGFLDKLDKNDHSVVVRTASTGVAIEELDKEYKYLKNEWDKVMKSSKSKKQPALLKREQPLLMRAVRDNCNASVSKILIDDSAAFQQVHNFLTSIYSKDLPKLEFYSEPTPIFYNFSIEQDIQLLNEKKVILPGGGYIIIDQTEALVAIDVNSGSFNSEGSVRDMVFMVNLEAVREVARQVRLRNLSGLIVIDLIDMQNIEDRRAVEEELRDVMKEDKSQYTILPVSDLGLLEFSRQRIGKTLVGSTTEICSVCKGKGSILSVATQINKILRQIKNKAQTGSFAEFSVYASPDLVDTIKNNSMDLFQKTEQQFNIKINIELDNSLDITDEAEIFTVENKDKKLVNSPAQLDKVAKTPLKSESPKTINPQLQFQKFSISKEEQESVFSEFQKQQTGGSKQEIVDPIQSKYLWKPAKKVSANKVVEKELEIFQAEEKQVAEKELEIFQAEEKQVAEKELEIFQAEEKQVAEKELEICQAEEKQEIILEIEKGLLINQGVAFALVQQIVIGIQLSTVMHDMKR